MLHPRAETGGVPPIIPKEYGLLLTCYALYVVSFAHWFRLSPLAAHALSFHLFVIR